MKIDIEDQFEISELSDVAYFALQTFAEAGLDLNYLTEVHQDLIKLKHWLLQLHYCYNKLDNKNFFTLCRKLNYDPVQLDEAFRVICRK